jgi:TolA-binding protein
MHWRLACRNLALMLGFVLLFAGNIKAQKSVSGGQPKTPVTFLESTKEQDGLTGSVRRVKTEFARFELKEGRLEEGPLQLLELTTYSLNGNRVENVTYPVPSAPVGKEEYRYDAKGNIVEMTLRANDGSIISREAYEYEFDRFGNWKKMVTSLVVFEGGELKREPVEVTYRTIAYYFDDAVAGIVDSNSRPTMPAIPGAITQRSLYTDDIVTVPPIFTTIRSVAPQIEFGSEPPKYMHEIVESQPTAETAVDAVKSDEVIETKSSNVAPTDTSPENETNSKDETASPDVNPVSSSSTSAARSKAFVLYKAGLMNFESGDEKGAVAAYLESLKLEPGSAQVYLSLGHAYIRLKKTNDAIKAFKKAVTLNPELAEAHYGLGFSNYEQHRIRDAVNAFKNATRLHPEMAKAHFGLALAYLDLGDDKGLMEEYQILQRLDQVLARKLLQTFPDTNLPCLTKPFCK